MACKSNSDNSTILPYESISDRVRQRPRPKYDFSVPVSTIEPKTGEYVYRWASWTIDVAYELPHSMCWWRLGEEIRTVDSFVGRAIQSRSACQWWTVFYRHSVQSASCPRRVRPINLTITQVHATQIHANTYAIRTQTMTSPPEVLKVHTPLT